MNDQTVIGTAIIVPEGTSLEAMFKEENGLDGVLGELESRILADIKGADVETAKGRKIILSAAHKGAQSKAELDRRGKALTEQQRAEITLINKSRNTAEERLKKFITKIRKPVTDWKIAEEQRVFAHKERLQAFAQDRAGPADTSSAIQLILDEITAVEIDEIWQEFQAPAKASKAEAIAKYEADLAMASDREAKDAKIAKLEAEAEEREKAEDDRIQKENAEREEREAKERVEADRVAEEERAAKEREDAALRDQQEKEQQEEREAKIKQDAEDKAREDAAAKESEYQDKLKAEQLRADQATENERLRLAKEREEQEQARKKRKADKAHLAEIHSDITTAIEPLLRENIAAALMDGRVPHITVNI